ncbi:MAG TPA: putative toxin-antitoxin system toxin component, PIN family [Terracidiphilus sp.]|nr:putative toxin-antitoxin system toxin component, PIN family [Terracidiphilus sp.]
MIDTSSLVGAVIRPDQVLQRVLDEHDLFVSSGSLSELERVLLGKKLQRYGTAEERLAFIAVIRRNAIQIDVTVQQLEALQGECRDTKDREFLAIVEAIRAHVLVSSDQDLLVLNPWRGIPILTPAQFLEQCNESAPHE